MRCTFREAVALATRARIDGKDWLVRVGETTVALRLPSTSADPRVAYAYEMTFDAAQEVDLTLGSVVAKRSDDKAPAQIKMWLFREVPISEETVLQNRSGQAA